MDLPQQNTEPETGERPRVLLVEDADADVVAFHRHLSSKATEVEFQRARNATEALEMLHLQHEIGRAGDVLVLLDLDLDEPKEGSLLEPLRADPALGGLPVVGYTADMQPDVEDLVAQHDLVGCLNVSDADAAETLVGFVASYLQLQV